MNARPAADWSALIQPGARDGLGLSVGYALADWRGAIWPPPRALEGRWCRLEALDVGRHGEALFAHLHADEDGANWTYMNQGPFANQGDFLSWLAGVAIGGTAFYYAIVDMGSGAALGLAAYMNVEADAGCLEVGGLHFSAAMRRGRLATEALYLLLRQAFELGFRRCEWRCDAHNAASVRAALRLGFVFECLWRKRRVSKGRNRDAACFSLLDGEWPARGRALEAWLHPANFDRYGAQRRRLAEFAGESG
ncbi:GNAT family N-acetyltransferase [Chromobacterium alticapitis]|uniref:GNAT family N-acetyltransferase n=2 Tax=Chromobacterium alticapitis TaxID=2073169 RepID=A0A2S5DDK8_9NEIS|nr:GNAT family N-acetyltransferase [Chromobacterium alticapitis]